MLSARRRACSSRDVSLTGSTISASPSAGPCRSGWRHDEVRLPLGPLAPDARLTLALEALLPGDFFALGGEIAGGDLRYAGGRNVGKESERLDHRCHSEL